MASEINFEDLPFCLDGRMRASRMSRGRLGFGRVVISFSHVRTHKGNHDNRAYHTSNDCAYHSCTLLIEGISLRPSGRSPSSCTRCARRIGSSSERNWEARKRVPIEVGKFISKPFTKFVQGTYHERNLPVEGFSPN